MILDLHGHSINKNIFAYGCNHIESPHICKAFPYLLSRYTSYFSYPSSRFSMHKSKEKTLRLSLFKELNVSNTFTIEASFCGGSNGKYGNIQYTSEMLCEFGAHFCKALLYFDECLVMPKSIKDIYHQKETDEFEQSSVFIRSPAQNLTTPPYSDRIVPVFDPLLLLNNFIRNDELIKSGEIDDNGSDSDPSDDNITEKKILRKLKEKKKTIMRKLNIVSVSGKSLPKPKCKICGKIDKPGHQCLSPINKIDQQKRIASTSIKTYHSKTKFNPPTLKEKSIETPISFRKEIPKLRIDRAYMAKIKVDSSSLIAPFCDKIITKFEGCKKMNADNLLIMKLNKSSENLKNSRSLSPLQGAHLLGIIEGVSCRLQCNDRKERYAIKK